MVHDVYMDMYGSGGDSEWYLHWNAEIDKHKDNSVNEKEHNKEFMECVPGASALTGMDMLNLACKDIDIYG
jgi:hypothetical protein